MNVYILSALSMGQDIIDIIGSQIAIKGVIGLSDRKPGDVISDFVYQKKFCKEKKIRFVEVDSYSLDAESDKSKLLNLCIDVLIVAGWQRLLPDWLIRHCRICAIGMHGSTDGITGGRGRSPQNWALILGKKEFYISIFRINAGIDSGEIIDTEKYALSGYDDIRTSYYKACWLTAEMVVKSIKNGRILKGKFKKQDETKAYYLPQRVPEDGMIDWTRKSGDVYNFVRALTKPYPGAYSKIRGKTVKIFKAIPFEIPSDKKYKPGEVAKVFNKGDFLVGTGSGFVLVAEYETEGEFKVREKEVFEPTSFQAQMKKIIKRHRDKYPELRIPKDILRTANRS